MNDKMKQKKKISYYELKNKLKKVYQTINQILLKKTRKKMTTYKLTYFHAKGRAELIRLSKYIDIWILK